MKTKRITPAFLLVVGMLCVSLTLSAQSSQMKGQKADLFEDAHKSLYEPKTDAAKKATDLTEAVSKSLPGTAAVGKISRKNLIDEYVFDRIERDGIPHAGLSTDAEFVRRVYLDATGLLPTPDAVRAFVTSTDPAKREKLVDALIGTEEFAEQWAWFWGDLFRLMSHSGNAKNAFQYWNKEWLRADRPYNEVVAGLLAGRRRATVRCRSSPS